MKMDSKCASLYEQLAADRETYLTRAREAALVTIPTLVPPEGHSSSTKYYTPYQSVGARGVNNLAAKLLLSLLPPNSPFFRLQVDDYTAQEIAQTEGARAKVDEAFNRIERAVMTEIETIGLRSPVFEVLKQLLVAGNALLWLPKDGRPRVYRLDSYVVKRDPVGNLLDVVIKEELAFEALSEEEKQLLKDADNRSEEDRKRDNTVTIYTRYYRDGDKYRLYQEIEGQKVPGSEGTWSLDKGPILALRWTSIDGEDYGRSYVEEYIGDLASLEGLMKSILDGSAMSARMIWMVNPNGSTRLRDVAKANNGDIISGNANEVTVLQAQKHADMSVAMQTADKITERLAFAFLMNTAIQRNAERVTAEEIRFVAGELEDALGGVYSILSQEFQLPLVNRLIDRMTRQKRLPKLPKGVVQPSIVTGLEALGRGHDLSKYQTLFSVLGPLGADTILPHFNVSDLITRVGTSLGIDMNGLVKTEQQMAEERQQAMMAQQQQMIAETAGRMAERATPEVVKGMTQQAQGSNG